MERGKYTVLEGGEGCGKDACVQELQPWLREEHGIESVILREPHDDPIVGPYINELLQSRDENVNFANLDEWQQALLMNAARRGVMRQASEYMDEGLWVLSSRNYLSTIVYQGWAGLGITDHEGFNETAQSRLEAINTVGTSIEGAQPDLVLILDVDPEVGRQRMSEKQLDVFEQRPIETQQQIRQGYIRESDQEKRDGHPLIDANREKEDVFEEVKQHIAALAISRTIPE